MKRRVLALALAGLLALSGCSAMLNQTYTRVEPAEERLSSGEDPSVLEVEDRSALTTAVLSLVRQGVEHGIIRLKNYRGDVETDLSDACLEVAQKDPLGSYAVESIQHDWSHIISYYEANIYINYRRTHEQVTSLVRVTGSSAIRAQIKAALADFSPEVLLQVSYFAEDEDYIRALILQAYYESPAVALGMPDISVTLYPNQTAGYRRLVEIQLNYPESPEVLRGKSTRLAQVANELCRPLLLQIGDEVFPAVLEALRTQADYLPEGGDTAWHTLVLRSGGSEGFALAAGLLCYRLGRSCITVSGALNGVPHLWNIVRLNNGEYRHLDATDSQVCLLSDAAMLELGYTWDRENESIPLCGEQPPEPTPEPTPDISPELSPQPTDQEESQPPGTDAPAEGSSPPAETLPTPAEESPPPPEDAPALSGEPPSEPAPSPPPGQEPPAEVPSPTPEEPSPQESEKINGQDPALEQ